MVIMIILFHYITQCFRMIAFEAKKFFSSSGVQTSTTCVAKRNCRSSRPLGYPTRYKIELIFLVIIHANSYDCGRSRQTLGYVSFELIRVMTSTLTFQHIKSPKSWRLLETTFLPSSAAAFCLFSYLVQRSYYQWIRLTPIPSTVFMYNPHTGRLKFDLFWSVLFIFNWSFYQ